MFVEVLKEEKKLLNDLAEYGYVFDWTESSCHRCKTVSFVTNGDLAGLIEFERQPENFSNFVWLIECADLYKGAGVAGKLLAYVGKDSLEQGFEGFVYMIPKSPVYNHFILAYGAKPIGKRKLLFDTNAINKLITKFLEER